MAGDTIHPTVTETETQEPHELEDLFRSSAQPVDTGNGDHPDQGIATEDPSAAMTTASPTATVARPSHDSQHAGSEVAEQQQPLLGGEIDDNSARGSPPAYASPVLPGDSTAYQPRQPAVDSPSWVHRMEHTVGHLYQSERQAIRVLETVFQVAAPACSAAGSAITSCLGCGAADDTSPTSVARQE